MTVGHFTTQLTWAATDHCEDSLESSLSTFAAEMAASAMILGMASPRSLVLLDEVSGLNTVMLMFLAGPGYRAS